MYSCVKHTQLLSCHSLRMKVVMADFFPLLVKWYIVDRPPHNLDPAATKEVEAFEEAVCLAGSNPHSFQDSLCRIPQACQNSCQRIHHERFSNCRNTCHVGYAFAWQAAEEPLPNIPWPSDEHSIPHLCCYLSPQSICS